MSPKSKAQSPKSEYLSAALVVLAGLLIGAGLFCLCVKLPHYAFSCGVISIAAILISRD